MKFSLAASTERRSALEKYLQGFGASIPKNRKRVFTVSNGTANLEVALLTEQDVLNHSKEFDMVLLGVDRWLEQTKRQSIRKIRGLMTYPIGHRRISLMVKEGMENESISKLFYWNSPVNIATSYPTMAAEYLSLDKQHIVPLNGSVEAAVGLGWADGIFDVLDSGKRATENGLVEVQAVLRFGAVLGSAADKIEELTQCGLATPEKRALSVAFEGAYGSNKSFMASQLVKNGIWSNNATAWITPYSSEFGRNLTGWKDVETPGVVEWGTHLGQQHWRVPEIVQSVYNRNIITCLAHAFLQEKSEDEMREIVDGWKPLPHIIFYCEAPAELCLDRMKERCYDDEFASPEKIVLYKETDLKVIEWLRINTDLDIVNLNTNQPAKGSLHDVKTALQRLHIKW